MTRRMPSPAALVPILVLALPAGPATAAGYTFHMLAAEDCLPCGYFPAEINQAGTVGLVWRVDGALPADVFIHDGQLQLVYESKLLSSWVDINDAGQLAFIDWSNASQAYHVLRWDSGNLVSIADSTGDIVQFINMQMAINASGEVAYVAHRNGPPTDTIYLGDGTTATEIARRGTAEVFASVDAAPHVNDAGMVVFRGVLNSPFQFEGIFMNDGTGVQTVEDEAGVFSAFGSGPYITDGSAVVFVARSDATGDWGLHVEGGGLPLTTIADESDGFIVFGGTAAGYAMNASGDVVFLAQTPGFVKGLFCGPDPVNDKIIARGDVDPFFGGTVMDIEFQRGLNDAGQIAFGIYTELASGESWTVQIRADPITALPGDIDGDGSVGFADLLIVLASWGPCPPPCPPSCPADLDGNCVIGFPDLLVVLANWGP